MISRTYFYHEVVRQNVITENSEVKLSSSLESPDIDQIAAEFIKAGGRTIPCEFLQLIISIGIRKNCLRSGRSRSLYLSIRRMIKQYVVIIEVYHFC